MKHGLISAVGIAFLAFVLIFPGLRAAETPSFDKGFAPPVVQRDHALHIPTLPSKAVQADAEQDHRLEPKYTLQLKDYELKGNDVSLSSFSSDGTFKKEALTADDKKLLPLLLAQLNLEPLPLDWTYDIAPDVGDLELSIGPDRCLLFAKPLSTFDVNHGLYYLLLMPHGGHSSVPFVTTDNPVASIHLLLNPREAS